MIDIGTINSEFAWARNMTTALLVQSEQPDLDFAMDDKSGPLWKQFRHIGRVHENYLTAIETGVMAFATDGCTYKGGASKQALESYFADLWQRHRSVLSRCDPQKQIKWFEDTASLALHLVRLVSHETLHHGQLLLAWRALEKAFPDEWKAWGE